ncbi:hypothetical protein [Terrarubrum flagellatum]|uniref:hypothetical protein n=1 Tax=Terrirubrum flagellatum TaxID=2895980 RepID=UPI0031450B5B
MNAPFIPPNLLRFHFDAIERKFPLKIVGLLPRGFANHVSGEDVLDLLVEKTEGLSYYGLFAAEHELAERLGRPVGMLLRSGLKGREADEADAAVRAV